MLKIVVFDGGWGGEIVASYLSKELGTVEVIRVIDWANAPYEEKDLTTVLELVYKGVAPYIGKADVIVLGGYVVSLAEKTLRERYPSQKFVSMGINYRRILSTKNSLSTITILGDAKIQNETLYNDIAKNLPCSTLIFPDCSGWENLIDLGEMSVEILRYELQDYFELYNGPSKNLTTSPQPSHQIKKPHLTSKGRKQIADFISIEPAKSQNNASLIISPPREKESQDKLLQTDTVLVLDTHYWEIIPEIEHVFGYRVNVLDFRKKLFHDVCLALELPGIHG